MKQASLERTKTAIFLVGDSWSSRIYRDGKNGGGRSWGEGMRSYSVGRVSDLQEEKSSGGEWW